MQMAKQSFPSHPIYKIDYKNVNLLRRYIGVTGKILPRRVTKLSAKEHRSVSKSIRQSRRVGIIPYVFTTNSYKPRPNLIIKLRKYTSSS